MLESETCLYDIFNLVQEPLKSNVNQFFERPDSVRAHLVDLRQLVDFINGIVFVVHCVGDDEKAHIGGF